MKIDGVDRNLLTINDTHRETDLAIIRPHVRLNEITPVHQSVPIYLSGELKYLGLSTNVTADGTFAVVRSLSYTQIYIFSVSFEYLYKTFNMPVCMFLMKKKGKAAYIEVLQFLKIKYQEQCGKVLTIKRISSDCEHAFILAVNHVFPETQVVLCSIHIIRALMRNMKSKVDTNYFKNPVLVVAWRVITGCIFLDLQDPEIFEKIDTYLKVNIPSKLA